jgi:hypothetical protein
VPCGSVVHTYWCTGQAPKHVPHCTQHQYRVLTASLLPAINMLNPVWGRWAGTGYEFSGGPLSSTTLHATLPPPPAAYKSTHADWLRVMATVRAGAA